MNQCKKYGSVAFVAIALIGFAGCRQSPQFSVPVDLNDSLGRFEVTAGEPVQNDGTINTPDSSVTVGSGSLQIDPEDVSFTPPDNGGAKGTTTYQTGGTFTVVVGVSAEEDLGTVCEESMDEYGPFTVTVNAENEITSISPDSVTLDPGTIALINSGAMSVCITVESTIDGTVNIDQLELSVGL